MIDLDKLQALCDPVTITWHICAGTSGGGTPMSICAACTALPELIAIARRAELMQAVVDAADYFSDTALADVAIKAYETVDKRQDALIHAMDALDAFDARKK